MTKAFVNDSPKRDYRPRRDWALAACLVLCFQFVVAAPAVAEDDIVLKVGETRLMTVKPVSRVAVGHAGVVDVKVVTPNELLLVGKGEGKTAILLWPHDGPPTERSVRVSKADPALTTADLATMIRDEGISVRVAGGYLVLEGEAKKPATYQRLAKIEAAFGGQILDLVGPASALVAEAGEGLQLDSEPASNSDLQTRFDPKEAQAFLDRAVGPGLWTEVRRERLVVGGEVKDEEQVARVRDIAGLFDDRALILVSTAKPQTRQISVKARVVEIQRSAMRELGVEWPAEVRFGRTARPVFGQSESSPEDVTARLRAFEQAGKARMLAEPNLVVVAGSEGSFVVGGQVPIPVQQESGTTVEWKEYGVRLRVVPNVEEGDLIRLAIRPEVSTLDWVNGTRVDGAVLPALRVRTTETVVVHKNGGTVVVAGLLHSLEGDNTSQTPWLAQLPLIGRLFRMPRTSSEDTELAVFVSTSLVGTDGVGAMTSAEPSPIGATSVVNRRIPQ